MGSETAAEGTDSAGLKARWTGYLQTHKLNTTQQRELIVDQFLGTKDHVSIDELLAQVREKSPKVGYATVYRTLKLLVEAGLASHRQLDRKSTRLNSSH